MNKRHSKDKLKQEANQNANKVGSVHILANPKTISELFTKEVKTINKHLICIYEEGELLKSATILKFEIVKKERNRAVKKV